VYKIIIPDKVKKKIKRFSKVDRKKIEKGVSKLIEDPFVGKKLQGQWKEMYSVRAWPYRIIYSISKQKITVYVINIAYRRDVYRK